MKQKVPAIGRVVHFVSDAGRHLAADVCAVVEEDPDEVGLFVKDIFRFQAYFLWNVRREDEGKTPGTWHWPEYVPDVEA